MLRQYCVLGAGYTTFPRSGRADLASSADAEKLDREDKSVDKGNRSSRFCASACLRASSLRHRAQHGVSKDGSKKGDFPVFGLF
jgi:hypothetical protein